MISDEDYNAIHDALAAGGAPVRVRNLSATIRDLRAALAAAEQRAEVAERQVRALQQRHVTWDAIGGGLWVGFVPIQEDLLELEPHMIELAEGISVELAPEGTILGVNVWVYDLPDKWLTVNIEETLARKQAEAERAIAPPKPAASSEERQASGGPDLRLGMLAPSPSEAAKTLSKLGAAKGGRSRAANLSPERRREIARQAAQTRWDRPPKPAASSD